MSDILKMTMKYKQVIILLFSAVLVIALLFRLIGISYNPPSMTWDEVAWGYNAYALGIDGKDEFGRFLPITYLESFGDYKPPAYAYLDILPVKLFGLNEFSTRLPSALAGIGTVFMTFFLVLRLFPESKKKYWYALAVSGILAISPWHILLSRGAFEANVATFFIVTAIWAFLAGISNKKWMLFLSAVCFCIPFYTFNSPRAFLPLFIPLLVIFSYKKLLVHKPQTIVSVVLALALLLPLVPFLLSPQAKLRYNEVNIFSDLSLIQISNQEIANDNNSIIGKALHNRRIIYAYAFLQHYFDEFSPTYLFFKGDVNPKFSIQSTGELYIWCIPFFYAGWFFLFKKKEGYWWILPLWVILGIIPASAARETPHALRTELILPVYQIIIGCCLVDFLFFLQSQKQINRYAAKSCVIVLLILVFFEITKFAHSYIVHYPIEYSGEWQDGYKASITYVESVQNNYDQIDVSDSLGRPYIYYLFYMKIPPSYFREHANISRDVFGFVTVNSVGKYFFGGNLHDINNANKKVLFIDDPHHLPTNTPVLKTFTNLDGTPALVAYTSH